jgi:hypothetical protein
LKLSNDYDFGHYLAGFIDGNGSFNSNQQLIITFHSLDASLAYRIKKRLGFGKIKFYTNSFHLIISSKKNLVNIINLINGKLRTVKILNQIIDNILNHSNYTDLKKYINLNLNSNKDFKNH